MFFSRKVGKKGNCPIFRRLVCLWKDLFCWRRLYVSFSGFLFCEMWFLGCLFILFFLGVLVLDSKMQIK